MRSGLKQLGLIGACALAGASLPAQTFDAPVQVKAGDSFVGHQLNKADRLYPSPALHDLDGDGKLDMVIGDLRGTLTVTTRTKDGWGEEKVLNGADGKPLKFSNW